MFFLATQDQSVLVMVLVITFAAINDLNGPAMAQGVASHRQGSNMVVAWGLQGINNANSPDAEVP